MGVPIGTVVELAVEYEVNTQRCINVWHYVNTVQSGVNTLDAELAEIRDKVLNAAAPGTMDMVGKFKACWSNDVVAVKDRVQFVWPTRYRSLDTAIQTAGTIATPCDAQNLQFSFTKYSALASRRGIGAMRVGGMPTAKCDSGNLEVNYKIGPVQTLRDNLSLSFVTQGNGTWVPCIHNRKKKAGPNNVPPAYPGSYQTITGWKTQLEVRTQRSRTVGRGM